MKYEEIKNLTPEELRIKKREIKEALFDAKMKNTLGQLTNPLEIRGKRRDIARMETALMAISKKGEK